MVLRLVVRPLELAEYRGHGLPHHVRQHVHPPPVGHPDDEAVRPQLARPIDRVLQCRDDRLSPVQPEPLRGVELPGEEALEGIREAQPFEDVHALLGVCPKEVGMLDPLADPVALRRRSDVHVLDADGVAVRLAEAVDDLPEGDLPRHVGEVLEEALVPPGVHALEVELAVEVLVGVEAVEAHGEGVGEPVLGEVVGRFDVSGAVGEGVVGVEAEGVDVGAAMSVDLEGADEMRHSQRIGGEGGLR